MIIIAFEGIDNAGKTTQCLKLQKRLEIEGYQAVATIDQPSPIHKLIKSYFQRGRFSPHLKTLLFVAELFDHWDTHLSSAEIVIFDRYVYSLLVYGLMEGCDRQWIESVITPLPKANLVVYLDIPPEVYLERVKGRDDYISPYPPNRLAVVRGNYLSLIKEANFFIVDGIKKEAEIEELISRRVLASL